MSFVNVEIKARCEDTDKIRALLRSRNAAFKGRDHQIDTYFKVNEGRLKLREGTIENNLIFYKRENTPGPKQSDIILASVEPKSEIRGVLEEALGKLVVVDKIREIYFLGNVKFHLDDVRVLGSFVEIEAIGNRVIQRPELLKQCGEYVSLFGIKEEDMISVSYSDMLLERLGIRK